jgi:hypothetical protein
MASSRKTPTSCERDTRQLWGTNLIHPLARDVKDTLLTPMSLCMSVLIVTRKRGDGGYYFALWQTNNNISNTMLQSESALSCLLRVRSMSVTSRAKKSIKFVPHSCLVSLSHKVGVFLEGAICYFIYAKFAVSEIVL